MKSLSRWSLLLFSPLLTYGMSFNTLCQHAYEASGDLIQTQGELDANRHEKASDLAAEPLIFEGSSSSVKGKDPKDSGMLYGGMLNFQIKKPALQEAKASYYEQNAHNMTQEIQRQQKLIQVELKRKWLLATLAQERLDILEERNTSAKEAYALGEKKLQAGRMSKMELIRFLSEWRKADQDLAMGKMELEHTQHALQESAMLDETILVDDLPFAFIHNDERTEKRIDEAGILEMINGRIASLETQIRKERYQGTESVTLGAGATREPSQERIDFLISIPLALSEKNDRKIAALMAEKSALIHRRELTHRKLRMNIHTLLDHLENREKRYHDTIIAQKEQHQLMQMAQKGYEGGVVSQFEYLSTKNSYYDARLRALALKQEYIEEMSAMEEKLGRIWE